MIENLTHELYHLGIERINGAKLHENIILESEGEKFSKTYFNVLKKEYGKSNNLLVT